MSDISLPYSKANPFLATIKERYSLCRTGSKKNTQHIVLDLKGSGISYQVGDSIGVFPVNDPALISRTLQAMKATGAEKVTNRHTGEQVLLYDLLEKKVDVTDVTRKLLSELAQRQSNPQKKEKLESLIAEGNRDALKDFQAHHEVWDTLLEHHEVIFTPQEICNLLLPLLPRFYSIASSMNAVGEEVHLTVALLAYEANGHARRGVCTHYLCALAPMDQPVVPIYIQPHHGFTVPTDPSASLIMIGPGTGIAPFRAFMQERIQRQDPGRNWLFFGEWTGSHEFFYEEYWRALEQSGKLRLDLAFSRDQDYKIYVQHRMLEHGEELFQWLESGSYIFVCGDAHRMAKDVEAALHKIVQEHGKMDEASAKEYVKRLRADKRYVRDVY